MTPTFSRIGRATPSLVPTLGGETIFISGSNFAATDEVYVETFPRGGGKWQVSTDGGIMPVWARDGSELYYVDSDASATLIGNVGTPVSIDIDSNKDALVVVNQPRAYHWNGILYAGTHTGSGNNATVMTDSAASFVPDTP